MFVALASADLHVQRVKQRVSLGGHDIPEAAIRRRFVTAFDNLSRAIPLSDNVVVFDNSSGDGVRCVIDIQKGTIVANHLRTANGFDLRVADRVAQALAISAASLLGAGR